MNEGGSNWFDIKWVKVGDEKFAEPKKGEQCLVTVYLNDKRHVEIITKDENWPDWVLAWATLPTPYNQNFY